MPFDKEYYNQVKGFMLDRLNKPPWCYDKKCPVDWAAVFLPLISDCVHREDYETAQAITDAIIEFCDGFGGERFDKEKFKLKLPDFKEIPGLK